MKARFPGFPGVLVVGLPLMVVGMSIKLAGSDVMSPNFVRSDQSNRGLRPLQGSLFSPARSSLIQPTDVPPMLCMAGVRAPISDFNQLIFVHVPKVLCLMCIHELLHLTGSYD